MTQYIMNLLKGSITVLVIGSIASCVPTSKEPLSDDKTSKVDERLLGTWRVTADPFKERTLTYQRSARSQNLLEALQNNGTDSRSAKFDVYVAETDQSLYLSLSLDNQGFLLVRYEFPSPKKLSIRHLNKKFVSSAIANGTLKGKMDDRKVFNPTITESSAGLHEFLKRHGTKCWDKNAIEYERVQ